MSNTTKSGTRNKTDGRVGNGVHIDGLLPDARRRISRGDCQLGAVLTVMDRGKLEKLDGQGLRFETLARFKRSRRTIGCLTNGKPRSKGCNNGKWNLMP